MIFPPEAKPKPAEENRILLNKTWAEERVFCREKPLSTNTSS
jgi:hypothetical protein